MQYVCGRSRSTIYFCFFLLFTAIPSLAIAKTTNVLFMSLPAILQKSHTDAPLSPPPSGEGDHGSIQQWKGRKPAYPATWKRPNRSLLPVIISGWERLRI